MKDLIEMWENRSEKYRQLARKSGNEYVVQGLLTNAEAYSVCADELKQAIVSQQAVAPDTTQINKCDHLYQYTPSSGGMWICQKCGEMKRAT